MNNSKDYWLREANRLLALALMGTEGKCFNLIEDAIECLVKYKIMINNERMR